MLKTISPIDNSVFVERPYATSSEIENALHLSDQTKLKWKNTSLSERKGGLAIGTMAMMVAISAMNGLSVAGMALELLLLYRQRASI